MNNNEEWSQRLAKSLTSLAVSMRPFLERYWEENGYPAQISFNGRDETLYPSDSILDLFDLAYFLSDKEHREYFSPLRSAIDPARGVLRSHPALSRALGNRLGVNEVQVQVLDGTTLTSLTSILVGLLERGHALGKNGSLLASRELANLLELSRSNKVPTSAPVAYDFLLFYGVNVPREVKLDKGLSMQSAFELSEFVDFGWFKDWLPDAVRSRNWHGYGVVARPFHWTPSFHHKYSMGTGAGARRPDLAGDALQFLDLISIAHQTAIIPLALVHGAPQKSAMLVLGKHHSHGGVQPIRHLGFRHDAFRRPRALQASLCAQAKAVYDCRSRDAYLELKPIIQRLASAMSRDGQYALDDQILDTALALEIMFPPSGKTSISESLRKGLAALLGSDEQTKNSIRDAATHFYGVRSAIVHGPTNAKRRDLLKDRPQAFRTGFNLARDALFKKLPTL